MTLKILADKRKELFEDLLKQFKKVKDIDKVLFVTFNCIDDQDKEFINKLKERFEENYTPEFLEKWLNNANINNEIIGKLVGEDLK